MILNLSIVPFRNHLPHVLLMIFIVKRQKLVFPVIGFVILLIIVVMGVMKANVLTQNFHTGMFYPFRRKGLTVSLDNVKES